MNMPFDTSDLYLKLSLILGLFVTYSLSGVVTGELFALRSCHSCLSHTTGGWQPIWVFAQVPAPEINQQPIRAGGLRNIIGLHSPEEVVPNRES